MNKEEIKKIADLARLEISDEESEKMAGEIDSILGYIDQIKSAEISDQGAESRIENASVRNVMREDSEPHKVSENTKVLIDEVPDSQDDLVKVKKILNN
jgi:aspartyl-tRNA(Asn)/glutamyl-tRNA(Gln) amidotransferase subunit C